MGRCGPSGDVQQGVGGLCSTSMTSVPTIVLAVLVEEADDLGARLG